MEKLFQDLRYGIRVLAKSPGLAFVAIITLALGIGANTAIFSVVNAVLLRPLPYEHPERLALVWETNPKIQIGFDLLPASAGSFTDWRNQSQSFEDLSLVSGTAFNLTGTTVPEKLTGASVSASFFKLLGVEPAVGRTFTEEEDRAGANRVVVISHSLWQSRWAGDPDIVGKTLTLDNNSYTVIGIMPKGFNYPKATDLPSYFQLPPRTELWTPMALTNELSINRGNHNYGVLARLKPGVTIEQAQSEMTAISQDAEQKYPIAAGWGAKVVSLEEQSIGDIRLILLVLLGAVGFVLLIACANVANLLLARATSRQKEIAIRTALGASRLQIIRQLLTESMLLALLGGGFGILMAVWGIDALLALSPGNLPRIDEVNIDVAVIGFTFASSLLTGVIFGLAPAVQVSKTNLHEFLKEGARGSTGGGRANRVRSLLVVSEIALSLILLIGAGLMIRSFVRLMNVNPGFNPQNVLTMQIFLPQSKYSQDRDRTAFFKQVINRVEALPGVETAGAITHLPLSGMEESGNFSIEGRDSEASAAALTTADIRAISPNYFRTMGIPIMMGRDFTEADSEQSAPVAIISESMAARYFPGEDPIGKRIKRGSAVANYNWPTIVGVAADVKHSALEKQSRPHLYFPYLQSPFGYMVIVARTSTNPESLATAASKAVWAVDKDQPVSNVKTMDHYLSEAVASRRFYMTLLGVFASVAMVLAAVGIYGVMSYSITQRTHEIGIRMALGAAERDVLKLVVGQAMLLAAVGVGIGMIASFALTRVLSSFLYGVTATDPLTFLAVSALLAGVALGACLVPARRAMKVDPMVALRYE
ncbi:MAG TPA: ABC transporter permease [Blastocatellia bacterium]|nr:ABC transporter permease [Blastocatellia bacterium]